MQVKYGANSDVNELLLTVKESRVLYDLKHDLKNKNQILFDKYLKKILNGSEWKAVISYCDNYSKYNEIELQPEAKNYDILDFIKSEVENKFLYDSPLKYFYFKNYCVFHFLNEDIDNDDNNYNKIKIRLCDLDKFIKDCNVIINFNKKSIEEIIKSTKNHCDNKIEILNKILEFTK
jgi:hypothetical protein